MRSPNAILYSSTTFNGTLNNGSWLIGVDENVDYGPTSQTGFYAGYPLTRYGYVVYKDKVSGGPSIRIAETDAQLIPLLQEYGATGNTISDVLGWAKGQNDILVTNFLFPKIVTENLQIHYDVGFTPSFPRSGSTIYDISNNTNNGTSQNNPIFSKDKYGYFILNGTNQYIQTSSGFTIDDSSDWTIEISFSSDITQTGSTYFPLLSNTVGNAYLSFTDYDTLSGLNNASGTFISTTNISQPNSLKKDFNYITIVGNSGGTFALYRNGVLCTMSSSGVTGTATFNSVGVANSVYGDGGLMFFRYYNKALTATEVQNNYNDFSYRFVPLRNRISIGESAGALIDGFGQAWTWGTNTSGILGDNTTINRYSPVPVCGNHKFISISVGNQCMIGIDINGQAWSWGDGNLGLLGNNSISDFSTPVAVCGNHSFCKLEVGFQHAVAIDTNNLAWSWGYNINGQLGDNTTTSRRTPVAVCGGHSLSEVSLGEAHSLGVDINGSGWAWGFNGSGQLGDNTTTARSTPVAVCGGHSLNTIKGSSYRSSLAIDYTGKTWGWGYNGNGMLGDNSTTDRLTPVAVCGGHSFCRISSGLYFSCGIDITGSTWCWGRNVSYELGVNGYTPFLNSYRTPVAVCGGHSFVDIDCNDYHTIAIDYTGQTWTWGDNRNSQLGYGEQSIYCVSTPVRIPTITNANVVKVGNGNYASYLSNTNYMSTWGYNIYGQLGTNSLDGIQSIPEVVYGNRKFSKIALGTSWDMGAIDFSGQGWTWGYGNSGQLGINNSSISTCTPVAVCGNHSFINIFGAYQAYFAIDKDGKLWSWGSPVSGQLGDNNSFSIRTTPVEVCGGHVFSEVAAKACGHVIALTTTGQPLAWGANFNGQLGDNSILSKLTPVAICGGHRFCSIGVGISCSFGVDTSGVGWAWGANFNGKLGDNTTVSKITPVQICGNHTFCKIVGGGSHTIGLDVSGNAWGWGLNSQGQLGDGTTVSKNTPVAVCGGHTFVDIDAGGNGSFGLDINGNIWVWGGNNLYGELGVGVPYAIVPYKICDYFM